ncbi:hypothetical protein G4G27_02065 [Sphingomonas sp. So64.6b]|uniref:FliH/SctL family protein n=1 Tax=Sphingomonas sp. So64.6b TaxID=2997354 RepID=UPI0015FF0353|nr:hypothetical protein [Sphingomonas sp. So64.6b]QNA82930.1 hypothetical protein G4G27_02065 [Sphingomonas sp. So64.6b]
MSGLIKAQSAAPLIKRFDAALVDRGMTAPRASVPRSAAETALDEALIEIDNLRGMIAEARDDGSRAAQVARGEGEAAGRSAAMKEADQRLAVLEQAARKARTAWDDRLAGLDALAVMIARSALAKLITDSDDLGDLVARQIARRIDAIRHESVVAIRVSTEDFADDDALDVLALRIKPGATEIIADPALASGDCRFDLQLGHVDLGVRSQWGELDAFLEGLALEGTVR